MTDELNEIVESETSLLERVTPCLQMVDEGGSVEDCKLREMLADEYPADIALLLESLPHEQRLQVWQLLDPEQHNEVLAQMHDQARASILEELNDKELVSVANQLEPELLVDVIDDLSEDTTAAVLDSLDEDYRQRVDAALEFEPDTAGRIMHTDVLSVRSDVTKSVVLRWLRRQPRIPNHTDVLMVVDDENHYLGRLAITDLLTGDPDIPVSELVRDDVPPIQANLNIHDVAQYFEHHDLVSLAVVDDANRLIGRITIDDVVDIIRDEADKALLNTAGLDEDEDLFAPVVLSARRRGVWLGINLVTVFLAAWVIGRFEEALDQIVALAILMPVVASMGGIAGSQTLTLTIRGLALNQVTMSNLHWLFTKEVGVGVMNGLFWSMVVAIVAYLWFFDAGIALIIALAMLLNLLAAAVSGIVIPVVLHRYGIDPALSGAVILTTVTDIVGFLCFLGLATLFLL